jgi:hypothetical protein
MFLGPLWITVAEWAATCIAIVLLFREIRAIMPRSPGLPFGDGHSVAGALRFDKGELAKAAGAVEEFVTTGKKDRLATLTMAALIRNDVPLEIVQKVVSVVVDYREAEAPPMLFRWALGGLDEASRRKRLAAVNEMVAAAVAAVSTGNAPAAGAMAVKTDQAGTGKVAE